MTGFASKYLIFTVLVLSTGCKNKNYQSERPRIFDWSFAFQTDELRRRMAAGQSENPPPLPPWAGGVYGGGTALPEGIDPRGPAYAEGPGSGGLVPQIPGFAGGPGMGPGFSGGFGLGAAPGLPVGGVDLGSGGLGPGPSLQDVPPGPGINGPAGPANYAPRWNDALGEYEYTGPIFNLCGNGIVDRVVNHIVCPVFTPGFITGPPLLLNERCIGFTYIEQCDDGNTFDNDGCSSKCMKECCGNGLIEEGEQCDLGQQQGPVLPNISPPADFPIDSEGNLIFLDTTSGNIIQNLVPPCSMPHLVRDQGNCSRHCQFIICGDGIVNGNEECDDGNDVGCDGCFNCAVEKPNTCPCNCVKPDCAEVGE